MNEKDDFVMLNDDAFSKYLNDFVIIERKAACNICGKKTSRINLNSNSNPATAN